MCFGNTSDATFGSFAYAAPFVYVECEGQGLVALNVNTSTPSFSPCDATCGAPNWTAGGTTTFGPPIVAGGAVWVASDGGGLTAYDATTGALIYQSAGFGINRFSTPAEAGGQVFVASHNWSSHSRLRPPHRWPIQPSPRSGCSTHGALADRWALVDRGTSRSPAEPGLPPEPSAWS